MPLLVNILQRPASDIDWPWRRIVEFDVPPEAVSGVVATGASGLVGAAELGTGLAGRGAGVSVGATDVEPPAGGAASGGESLANATTG